MDTDIKGLLKDKRVWAGAGVVALVGAAVFIKRGGGSSAANAVTGAASGPSGSYTQGTGDTTGTDIAGYLGGYQQQLQGQLNQYQQQLTDALGTLPKLNQNPYQQPTTGAYGYTGVLDSNASLGGLSKLYWGDEKYADLLRLANLGAISKNNGTIAGLNLIVPSNPNLK